MNRGRWFADKVYRVAVPLGRSRSGFEEGRAPARPLLICPHSKAAPQRGALHRCGYTRSGLAGISNDATIEPATSTNTAPSETTMGIL